MDLFPTINYPLPRHCLYEYGYKNVTAGDHGDDRTLDNIFLTDHVALDLRENVLALLAELLNVLFCNHIIIASLFNHSIYF